MTDDWVEIDHAREALLMHLINSVAEDRRAGRKDFADGVAFAIESLDANAVAPGFIISLRSELAFDSFTEVRALVEQCCEDARGDSDDAYAHRVLLESTAVGECMNDTQGPSIRFHFGRPEGVTTTWRPAKVQS